MEFSSEIPFDQSNDHMCPEPVKSGLNYKSKLRSCNTSAWNDYGHWKLKEGVILENSEGGNFWDPQKPPTKSKKGVFGYPNSKSEDKEKGPPPSLKNPTKFEYVFQI